MRNLILTKEKTTANAFGKSEFVDITVYMMDVK